ncbi:DUF393 domain-containing protein [Ferrimonas sediminicola]|uniref:DUF393 domain-containing protein n=1 Tax=Ferrimonas sediminicola TaxID=2569538 RepID=A0A4U1BJ00_9GAMM|nr:DUF393 domain-containing protein [Ferrimonas sediminicola]TKB51496.1 DUF393 domain-containing protein [Ferrimonas sediminicola]
MPFTLFVDNHCPLCRREIDHLRRWDRLNRLAFEDIDDPSWHPRFLQVAPSQCQRVLHGVDERGRLLTGLEVTLAAWDRVGRGHWVAWLHWPPLRPLSDLGYRHFARHRHRISAWLFDLSPCERGQCRLEQNR